MFDPQLLNCSLETLRREQGKEIREGPWAETVARFQGVSHQWFYFVDVVDGSIWRRSEILCPMFCWAVLGERAIVSCCYSAVETRSTSESSSPYMNSQVSNMRHRRTREPNIEHPWQSVPIPGCALEGPVAVQGIFTLLIRLQW